MPSWLRELWLIIADAFDELFLFPTSHDRRNVLICSAITARRLVAFDYWGSRRTVEPFVLGLVHPGSRRNESLLCYQTGGDAGSAVEEGWKLYRARDIRDLAVGREQFAGDRPGYDPDEMPMYRVYCRVVPAAGSAVRPAHAAAAGVAAGPSHNDLMERLRRRHPPSVADLGDLGELPENERPAPRNATPAPDDPSD